MTPPPPAPRWEAARAAGARRAWDEVLRQIGDWAGAEGTDLELNVLAVNAAAALKRWPVALAALARLAALEPAESRWVRMASTCHNNLGAELLRASRPQAAAAEFERALALWPDNREAAYNAARLALTLGDTATARRRLEALRAAAPDDAEVLALLLAACRDDASASAALAPALADAAASGHLDGVAAAGTLLAAGVEPDTAVLPALALADPAALGPLIDLGLALLDEAAPAPARRAFAHAARLGARGKRAPSLRAVLAERLGLPLVYPGREALEHERRRYAAGLEALRADAEAGFAGVEPALEQLMWTNFLLAYQGRDDVDLQRDYGSFLTRALAALAPELSEPPRHRAARRIGFVGSAMRDSTVGAYFGPWVRALAAARFEVTVFQLGPGIDDVTAAIAAPPATLVTLEHDIRRNAEVIRACAPDLIVYPDPAADARVFPLAALRLAPRQIAAWGHPVTTGLPAIDCFISCAEMEPDGARAQYSEALECLPGLGTDYRPAPRPAPAARADLGLPNGRVYLVPQSAWKVHPEADAVLARIAALDPGGTIVCFEGLRPGASRVLAARLGQAMAAAGAEPARQLRLLPLCPRSRFLQICAAADVMVDCLHWSGGNSALDALSVGLPIVACPGATMRSRQSLAMLRRLGVADALCAADPPSQATLAVAIARDAARRRALSDAIVAAHEALFGAHGALPALVDCVERLLHEPPRR